MHVPFLDLTGAHLEIRKELDAAYRRVVASGKFVLGPELEAFEAEFAEYCGVTHCVGIANGLDALRLVLEAYGIGAGDEVIVPGQTFIATWLAVSAVGALPVAVDVKSEDCNIDPDLLDAALSHRTRAIIAVHLFGRPAEMATLREFAEGHGLILIEDAAQAHGARYRGIRAGALGDSAAFSFYPAKNLGALGDAGAITTGDKDIADRVRLLRNYGSAEKYVHGIPGWNSRLDEMQAAWLRAKLLHLDIWNARRRRIAHRYLSELFDVSDLRLPRSDSQDSESAWHLFVARTRHRDTLMAHLAANGIQTLIHYPSLPSNSAAYSHVQKTTATLPQAEAYSRESVSLPIGPHMSEALQRAVIQGLRSYGRTSTP